MELLAEHPVAITHPEKLYWPEAGITKVQYMHYLVSVAPYMLHYLAGRPLTMIRYPNGIHGHSFYQKDCPQGAPQWVKTVRVWSTERGQEIHYVLVDSVATLLWLANLGCLELHVGFTKLHHESEPTHVAFDLDPTVPGFEPVREIALCLHELLHRLEIPNVAKTSGATGLQVFIPLAPGHTFDDTRVFTTAVAGYLESQLPNIATLERLTKNRGQKVYVDYPQHGHNRTLIAPYSARARVAATVSTPLLWSELARGCTPEDFTIHNLSIRLQKYGDLMQCGEPVSLSNIVEFLRRQPHASL